MAPATDRKIELYRDILETVNKNTDDFHFVLDIQQDINWFFGPVDRDYAIRDKGLPTNTTAEMLKIVHPADQDALVEDLGRIARGEQDVHDMDYRWINRKGQTVWVSCRGTVMRDAEGNPSIMVGRVSEEALRHLFNPLTGLWNKTKLRQDMAALLKKSEGYLMLLDVDGLAAINLSHGRDYGDSLLREIGQVLDAGPRIRGVYHIDHNNFAAVVHVRQSEQVQEVFDQVQDTLREKCTFTGSAVPINRDIFMDASQLIDSVNLTLKKAKQSRQTGLSFFALDDILQKITSLKLLEELKVSIQNNFSGFEVYYQPQVRSGSYDIFSLEALLRYHSESRGEVFPDEFIPLLEQSGLIREVGMWVLEQALTQCKLWREKHPDLRVSVNFSTVQFADPDIEEKIVSTLKKLKMPGSCLTMEITESIDLHNNDHFINRIKSLKTYGIHLAIDDFGTGYSNLGYLKQLDVDEIKIDRIFVTDIAENTYNHKLISNVIEFAKVNSIRVCCEGVESIRELAVLEGLQPHLMQGYLFDKPTTKEVITQTYMDETTREYARRKAFIENIYRQKGDMGIVYFNPKDILRENEVGLWVIRIKKAHNYFAMHADETMEKIMAVDQKFTPQESYHYWYSRIHPDYYDYVNQSVQVMMDSGKVVQLEYPWIHPELGEVQVRCSGRRVSDTDGMVVLEGYHRIISHVEGV